jgi:hypothetical protein
MLQVLRFLGSDVTIMWLLFVVLQYLAITLTVCSGVTVRTKRDPARLPQNGKQSMNY